MSKFKVGQLVRILDADYNWTGHKHPVNSIGVVVDHSKATGWPIVEIDGLQQIVREFDLGYISDTAMNEIYYKQYEEAKLKIQEIVNGKY